MGQTLFYMFLSGFPAMLIVIVLGISSGGLHGLTTTGKIVFITMLIASNILLILLIPIGITWLVIKLSESSIPDKIGKLLIKEKK